MGESDQTQSDFTGSKIQGKSEVVPYTRQGPSHTGTVPPGDVGSGGLPRFSKDDGWDDRREGVDPSTGRNFPYPTV